MLKISVPELSRDEWHGVKAALAVVRDCGCSDPAPAGSLRARIGRVTAGVIGAAPSRQELTAETRVVRDFVCETGRARRIAEHHVPALAGQGFSRAQIEALALLGS